MRKVTVIMKWSPNNDKWLAVDTQNNDFKYDFWDCGFTKFLFEKLNKKKPQKYTAIVRHEGDA